MQPPIKQSKWAKYPIGDVTQWFGENPALYAPLEMKGHNGIDLVRPYGEHLFAVEKSIVKVVKDDPGGYGRHIRLMSADGEREWTYGHLSEICVTKGQELQEGQFIGRMGNSGFVVSGNTPFWEKNPYAGTHLHFGLRLYKQGKIQNYSNGYFGSIDPLPYFLPPEKKSTTIFRLASFRQGPVLFQLAELMKKIGL